jgi:hypothetical protein
MDCDAYRPKGGPSICSQSVDLTDDGKPSSADCTRAVTIGLRELPQLAYSAANTPTRSPAFSLRGAKTCEVRR